MNGVGISHEKISLGHNRGSGLAVMSDLHETLQAGANHNANIFSKITHLQCLFYFSFQKLRHSSTRSLKSNDQR